MSPPVTENLRTYATRVEDGAVYVELDEEAAGTQG
jgi:nitrite reductase/ring-hydroxylating ferredoxin subunit